jgi:hypothetical protein
MYYRSTHHKYAVVVKLRLLKMPGFSFLFGFKIHIYRKELRTNLFPKEDFDSSLNPKRKPKSQGEAKVLNFGGIQYIMYEKEIINTSKI